LPDPRGGDLLRVLLAQLAPVDGDVAANAERLADVVRAHPSSALAAFPELFLTGYAAGARGVAALSVQDPVVEGVRAVAAEAGTAIVVGFAERGLDGALHNAALCVDRDGTLVGVHRKTHLFGTEESRSFVAGERLHVLELAGRRVAPLICFEMEFPELARSVAQAGAELIVTVAANMAPYSHDHDLASRARALDNRTPHAYVNRVGVEAGLSFVGGSQIADADGRLITSAGTAEAVLIRDVPVGCGRAPATDYLHQLHPGLPVLEAGAERVHA
jgi:predicted amidohydrolase